MIISGQFVRRSCSQPVISFTSLLDAIEKQKRKERVLCSFFLYAWCCQSPQKVRNRQSTIPATGSTDGVVRFTDSGTRRKLQQPALAVWTFTKSQRATYVVSTSLERSTVSEVVVERYTREALRYELKNRNFLLFSPRPGVVRGRAGLLEEVS